MNRAHVERPIYSGAPWLPYLPPHHGHPGHGFCPSCCHPRSRCCCYRECRKESKELLVQPTVSRENLGKLTADPQFMRRSQVFSALSVEPGEATAAAQRFELGYATAFIGGGCCVHLSIEYAPSSPGTVSAVAVLVQGSDDTTLAWIKVEQPGAGYQVKEGIIATQPGADLAVLVNQMTARVRWCEIFSC